ncbi:MAG: hypothetical protein A3G88_06040 [Omnitrophica WOR_2 bacterium RIFCSPLOWO2_12_FULL_63_16]|nr:MAG: hypothetical protein A3G88_06040 [Omnitrophica WOR_2 bacterium RIFCSPLOWO2_12_FULL_63_16]
MLGFSGSLLSVDVGSSALKLVELERAGPHLRLRSCGVKGIRPGEDRAEALRQMVAERGVTTSQAVLGLASPELIVKTFEFPPIPRKELLSAIRLEAEQAILNGHPMSEMMVDWHAFPANGGPNRMGGLLAVVPKSAVAARLQLAQSAGLKPVVVDVEGLALWNAYWALVGSRDPSTRAPARLASPNETAGGIAQDSAPRALPVGLHTESGRDTVLLVNVGAATTNLVIAKGPDDLLLVRDLRLGGGAIGTAHEAEWLSEIRDSLAYARSKTGLRALDAVYVSGGFAAQAIDPLQSAMEAPITPWNPLEQLARDERTPNVDLALGPLLAVAIGLALRQPS